MGKLGRNELRKVTAHYLNGIAVAVAASGGVAPMLGHQSSAVIMTTSCATSVALHLIARRLVRSSED